MAVLPIQISETGRQRLSTVLWAVHWMCAVCGLSIISIGLYIRIRIQDKVNLVEGYNGDSLPLMLITIGAITTVIDLAGGKLCQKVAEINRRQRLKSLLLPYLLLFIVLNVCIFVAGCMCFAHRFQLHQSFHRGLMKAMKHYKDKDAVKYEINQLQVDFECCGNDGYDDWFAVQWIGDDYLDKNNEIIQSKMIGGKYLNDDVPYSCCQHNVLRPCIHHHVRDNKKHFNYDYQTGLTLHEQGCKHALMGYFTTRLNRIGGIIMLIFILQSVIFLLLRYLQTSIKNAYDQDEPEGRAPGWLLANTPSAKSPGVDETDECTSSASDESFGIEYQPEGPDWNEVGEPIYENIPQCELPDGHSRKQGEKAQKSREGPDWNEVGEPIYENIPQCELPDGPSGKQGKEAQKSKKEATKSKKKSDKKSKSEGKSKSDNRSKSDKKSPGSTKKSSESTKKSGGSTKKSPGSTKKSTGSAKKSTGSTKKSSGSTKKSPGSTKKSPGSTNKSPGSTTKSPGSTKKSPGSTKKSQGSTKKSPGSTKKSPGSTKKSPGSTKKSPGSTKKSPGSTKKSPGSTKKSPGSTKKSPGSTKKSPGSTRKSTGSAKKSPRSTKSKSASSKPKSRGGTKQMSRKKPRMKNRNNNVESDYFSSSESSGESDGSQTPLLGSQCSRRDMPCDRHLITAHWWPRAFRKPESTYINISDLSDSSGGV